MNGLMLLADDTNTSSITTAITGMVGTVTSVITSCLPIVLPIAGIIVAASIGVKLFKKFAK